MMSKIEVKQYPEFPCWMNVRDGDHTIRSKRLVISKLGGYYNTVTPSTTDVFLDNDNDEMYEVERYENADPIIEKKRRMTNQEFMEWCMKRPYQIYIRVWDGYVATSYGFNYDEKVKDELIHENTACKENMGDEWVKIPLVDE